MTMPRSTLRALLGATVFPPLLGGSGAVADALARVRPDVFSVLATRRDALGELIPNVTATDASVPYAVRRVEQMVARSTRFTPGVLRAVDSAMQDLGMTRPAARAEIVEHYREAALDVLCLTSAAECYWLQPLFRKLRPTIASVMYIHGEEVPVATANGFFASAFRRELLRADLLIAVSRFTRDRLIATGVAPDRIEVVPNGVDVQRFTPGPAGDAVLDAYGLRGRHVLLTLARLDERKGQDMTIRALPRIAAARPDVIYVIAGGGRERAHLEQLAATTGVADRVVFTGPVDDTTRLALYRACDVYVMPNRTLPDGDTEGFGLVFLEAGACGKPVIGGRAGGVPDAIVDGETGLLVNALAPEPVADACLKLLGDGELCARLGAAGRRHADALAWPRQVARVVELLDELVARRRQVPAAPIMYD